MTQQLTATQLISFIRNINLHSKEEVRLMFQEWFQNPLKDSMEFYIFDDYDHTEWNDEIKNYLESIGFSVSVKPDDHCETGMTVTISVEDIFSSTKSTLSLAEQAKKLVRENVLKVYERRIQVITQEIMESASKCQNDVLLPYNIKKEVADYFKDQGFVLVTSQKDQTLISW